MKLVSHKFEEYESLIRTFENFNAFLLQDATHSYVLVHNTKNQLLKKEKKICVIFFFLLFQNSIKQIAICFLKIFNT